MKEEYLSILNEPLIINRENNKSKEYKDELSNYRNELEELMQDFERGDYENLNIEEEIFYLEQKIERLESQKKKK